MPAITRGESLTIDTQYKQESLCIQIILIGNEIRKTLAYSWQKSSIMTFEIFLFGPSAVRALPLAPGRNEGGHYVRYIFLFLLLFGPSGVRALPLAAGRNEGGHYFR